jgi:hypothetical protein
VIKNPKAAGKIDPVGVGERRQFSVAGQQGPAPGLGNESESEA